MAVYEQIETDFVGKLSALAASGIDVRPLPETEAEFRKAVTNSTVSIGIIDAEYGEPNAEERKKPITIGVVTEFEHVYVRVIIQARKLRGENGIYAIWEQCRDTLIGFKAADCDRAVIIDFKLREHTSNIFDYQGVFKVKRLVVQDYSEATEPLLVSSNFNENISNNG